ncbi:MAG: DNA polymerase III subunit epsilon, partial [Pseudomonadota bacterium]
HGITNEFLQDKPKFNSVAEDFIDFIRDAELVIHNAPFDVGFMDHEFRLCGRGLPVTNDICAVLDTLELARKLRPGQKNSLDALCKVYHVNNAHRTYHGALLDSQILADVYLAMTGGQRTLALQVESNTHSTNSSDALATLTLPETKVLYATAEELVTHQNTIKRIEDKAGNPTIWTKVFH